MKRISWSITLKGQKCDATSCPGSYCTTENFLSSYMFLSEHSLRKKKDRVKAASLKLVSTLKHDTRKNYNMDMFKTREGLRQRPAYADIASIPRRLSPGPVPR